MTILGDNPVRDYWLLSGHTANSSYLRYWNTYFDLVNMSRPQMRGLEGSMWPLLESIQTVRSRSGSMDLVSAHNHYTMEWERLGREPLLRLTEEDQVRGDRFLAEQGVDPGDWFVTLHVRQDRSDRPGYGRNAEIATYDLLTRKVVELGGWVFRLGNETMTRIGGVRVIDVAHLEGKESWLDVFLIARSRFLIATTSGPIGVAPSFGVPVLWTNAPDIAKAVYHPRSLMIPKLVRSPRGQLMTLDEMLASPVGSSDSRLTKFTDHSGAAGFEWVDNSREQLAESVEEMAAGWQFEESCLQSTWREKVVAVGSTGTTRISHTFLQNHAESLGL